MTYQFGLYEFDTDTNELRLEGRRVPLEPQPARALALLLGRAPDMVTREDLRAALWGEGTHVDFDRGLAYCIAQLRAALRDSADNPRFVQTLPRRGFKIIAPVTIAAAPPMAEPSPATAGSAAPRRHSSRYAAVVVAVLLLAVAGILLATRPPSATRPIVAVALFDNETGDDRYEQVVRQLSDVAVDRLTSLGPDRLGVIGNMATLRMPRDRRDLEAIQRETRASFIILGQLQPRDGSLTLLIHLIRLRDGTHLWVRRIVRPAGDSLAGIDEEAAQAVEEAVRTHVLPAKAS